MASQGYLVKCVFPSSVRHTGRAWAAGCTAAAGAETEKQHRRGVAALTAVHCPGQPAQHRANPGTHPHLQGGAPGYSAAHPGSPHPLLIGTQPTAPHHQVRTCRNKTGEIRRLVQGEKDKEPTVNTNASIYNLFSNILAKLPLPVL